MKPSKAHARVGHLELFIGSAGPIAESSQYFAIRERELLHSRHPPGTKKKSYTADNTRIS